MEEHVYSAIGLHDELIDDVIDDAMFVPFRNTHFNGELLSNDDRPPPAPPHAYLEQTLFQLQYPPPPSITSTDRLRGLREALMQPQNRRHVEYMLQSLDHVSELLALPLESDATYHSLSSAVEIESAGAHLSAESTVHQDPPTSATYPTDARVAKHTASSALHSPASMTSPKFQKRRARKFFPDNGDYGDDDDGTTVVTRRGNRSKRPSKDTVALTTDSYDMMMPWLLSWIESQPITCHVGFDQMTQYLQQQCNVHPSPCRTTLSKWLDGQVLLNNKSMPREVFNTFTKSLPEPQRSPAALFRNAISVLKEHFGARGLDVSRLLFIGELECSMWTRRQRDNEVTLPRSGDNARTSVIATVLVASTLQHGIVHMSILPGRSDDIAQAPFVLDALRELQKRGIAAAGSPSPIIAVHASRKDEILALPSLCGEIKDRVLSIPEQHTFLNMSALALELLGDKVRAERHRHVMEVTRQVADTWTEKVQQRQAVLCALLADAWTRLDCQSLINGW